MQVTYFIKDLYPKYVKNSQKSIILKNLILNIGKSQKKMQLSLGIHGGLGPGPSWILKFVDAQFLCKI